MKSAVLVNAYSARNAGDAAIMLATVQLVRDIVAEPVEIHVSSRYADEDRHFYAQHAIRTTSPTIPFPPRGSKSAPKRALTFLAGSVAVFLGAAAYYVTPAFGRRVSRTLGMDGLATMLEADLVLIAGGGYLYSSRRRLNITLIHMVATGYLPLLLRKPVVSLPQSVGPLSKRFDRAAVRLLLRALPTCVVRERISLSSVEGLRLARRPLVCPDVALYGWQPAPRVDERAGTTRTVCVVPMDWTWARPGTGDLDMASYRDKLAAVCEAMAREGWEVRLIGHSRIAEQSQDDTRVAQQIAQGVKSERVTVSELGGDADRVREGFASADVVIGTRLHSCLIALEAGTPAIALVYQPKTQGTYELLGLDEYCFDVETFRAEEVTALASAVSDSVRREAFAAAARGSRKKLAETYSELLRLSSARLDLAYGVREKGAA